MLIYISCRLMLLPIFRVAFFSTDWCTDTGWCTNKMQSTLKHMWKYFNEYTLIKYTCIFFCIAYRLSVKCQRLFLGVSLTVRKIPKKKKLYFATQINIKFTMLQDLLHPTEALFQHSQQISSHGFHYEFRIRIFVSNFYSKFPHQISPTNFF